MLLRITIVKKEVTIEMMVIRLDFERGNSNALRANAVCRLDGDAGGRVMQEQLPRPWD